MSWHGELYERPCPRWMQVRSPSTRQDRDCPASACPAHRAPPSPLPSYPGQISFTRRAVPARIRRCSPCPAQHSAGISLLLPEGEQESSFLLCLQPLSLHGHLSASHCPFPSLSCLWRQPKDTEDKKLMRQSGHDPPR